MDWPARAAALLALLSIGCERATPAGPRPPTPANVTAAALEVMQAARYCARVTVEASGRPRARTVAPLPPIPGDPPLAVWIATRPGTRKLDELRAEPRVVLYYFDAATREYATVSGRARLVEAEDEVRRRGAGLSRELYPAFPEDCVLIEVQPERVEVQGRGLVPDPDTWRPAALELTGPPATPPAPAE
jgi:general stress protein 26